MLAWAIVVIAGLVATQDAQHGGKPESGTYSLSKESEPAPRAELIARERVQRALV